MSILKALCKSNLQQINTPKPGSRLFLFQHASGWQRCCCLVIAVQVVVLGLNILLPLMTTDLLKFPKLCSLYYNLLVYVLENYPEQVVGLPAYHFGTLMSSLEFGLTCSTDSMVVGNALEGLTGVQEHVLLTVMGKAQNSDQAPSKNLLQRLRNVPNKLFSGAVVR
eukprot:1117640-Pelagomonas_calceolata.AAC.9